MKSIFIDAELLKASVANNQPGSKQKLMQFAQQYAVSNEVRKKAILLTSKIALINDAESFSQEVVELVDAIISGFSEEQIQVKKQESLQIQQQLSTFYHQRREVAFSCGHLTKNYPSSGFRLDDIVLEIRKGDITGVVGEMGSGKTTFFKIAAGELTLDSGEMAYPFLNQTSHSAKGIDWQLVKSHIAFVRQELPPCYGNLRENLQYEAAIHGIKGDNNLLQVDYVIARLGLYHVIDNKWKELSAELKFRFALAKALVWQPDLMILDEPLTKLDVQAQLTVLRDIKHLATSIDHPIAVLISSQHLHEIEGIADNLLFLRGGKAITESFFF